jgi:hypothetical protein
MQAEDTKVAGAAIAAGAAAGVANAAYVFSAAVAVAEAAGPTGAAPLRPCWKLLAVVQLRPMAVGWLQGSRLLLWLQLGQPPE